MAKSLIPKSILNTPFGVELGLLLARILPPGPGYWLGETIGWISAKLPKSPSLPAVRANLRVVCGENLPPEEVQKRAVDVFRRSGRCLYDFYRNFRNPEAISHMVEITPAFQRCIDRFHHGQAQFFAVPHFSNFDLVGAAAIHAGMRMQALTYAAPNSGYKVQNALRDLVGMEATPISLNSMRAALERLRRGGTVLTGVDRPPDGPAVPEEERPRFFDRPANLPTGYVRLAMTAGAPLVVTAAQTLEPGRYRLWASEPILVPRGGPAEVKRGAEVVLSVVAELIRDAPLDWRMFYPVWPDPPAA